MEHKVHQAFPCPKCGAHITVGQLFCSGCGQRFEYRCRHCGDAIADSSGFCTNCGGKLSHLAQHTHYRHEAKVEHTLQRPASQIGRYIVVVAIIFFMVGIIYAIGTSSQGASSNWLGGYNFAGQSPPSTPPVIIDDTDSQQPSEPVSNSSSYTMDQVITAAKQFSPECRLQTRRTGWTTANCPQYEDAAATFSAVYIGNRTWNVIKTCPINSTYNGAWYFYEENGQFVKHN